MVLWGVDMGVKVSQVMTLEAMKKSVVLLAGEDGLSNKISYVTVMETPYLYDYITGGEFVLSTLYSFQNDAKLLLDTVKKLMERNIAAIGIKPEPYFDQIPEELIALAEEFKIPLFEIKKESRYREIIKAVYAELNNYQTNLLIEVNSYYEELSKIVFDNENYTQLLVGLSNRLNAPVALIGNDFKILGQYAFSSNFDFESVFDKLDNYINEQDELPTHFSLKNSNFFPCVIRLQVFGYLFIDMPRAKVTNKNMLMIKQLVTFITLKLVEKLDAEQKILIALLDDILFKHSLPEKSLRERLSLHGLNHNNFYRVVVIEFAAATSLLKRVQAIKWYCNKIKEKIDDVLIVEKVDEIVIIASNQKQDNAKLPNWLKTLGEHTFFDADDVFIGVGPSVINASDINNSYTVAKNTIVAGIAAQRKGLLYYVDFLASLVLLNASGSKEQDLLVSWVLGPIMREDNAELLLDTIGKVILVDSLEAAADSIGIHVNTLRYRLNRIYDVTGFDFFSAKGRYLITTAYLMKSYQKGISNS